MSRKKTWRRRYRRDPWNDPETPLTLYVSPTLQEKLGLPKIEERPPAMLCNLSEVFGGPPPKPNKK